MIYQNKVPREFILLPSFDKKWQHLGLGNEELIQLENSLLQNPKIGAVMRGTCGIRKMRFAFEHKGKSGSMRIVYIDFELYEKIYLLDVFTKSEKDNLSSSERNILRGLVEDLEFSLEHAAFVKKE